MQVGSIIFVSLEDLENYRFEAQARDGQRRALLVGSSVTQG